MEKSLNSFHRRLLRIAINVRYPKIIKSKKLYTLTKQKPVSQNIQKRRLALLGHILRLHPDTPAQKAIDFYITKDKRPVGRPPATWLELIAKDLEETLKIYKIKSPINNKQSMTRIRALASDKVLWREEIARCTGNNSY